MIQLRNDGYELLMWYLLKMLRIAKSILTCAKSKKHIHSVWKDVLAKLFIGKLYYQTNYWFYYRIDLVF